MFLCTVLRTNHALVLVSEFWWVWNEPICSHVKNDNVVLLPLRLILKHGKCQQGCTEHTTTITNTTLSALLDSFCLAMLCEPLKWAKFCFYSQNENCSLQCEELGKQKGQWPRGAKKSHQSKWLTKCVDNSFRQWSKVYPNSWTGSSLCCSPYLRLCLATLWSCCWKWKITQAMPWTCFTGNSTSTGETCFHGYNAEWLLSSMLSGLNSTYLFKSDIFIHF